MTRKHSADDILQTIREMASTESGLHELNKWLAEAFFVVLTSPNATPEDRDRAWRELEKKKPIEILQLEPHPWTQVDPTRFPHTCPRCGAPAYVGLASVECSDGCV